MKKRRKSIKKRDGIRGDRNENMIKLAVERMCLDKFENKTSGQLHTKRPIRHNWSQLVSWTSH